MINKAILVGNLGADPDTNYTKGGKCVCNLSVATSFGTGENKNTEWHRVVAWDKTAENCGKFLKKGSMVYVEGRITTRSYDDKEGNKKYSTEVVANEVRFLDKSPGGGAETKSDGALPF
jgi:single-strand DNA-binding protein